ncbi:uncharacterized protein LOC114357615 [Ostrinia furnacalis]|uniref:uncharacterized protein LOC114357615 n=1 Tax=Ostrinia furnacalis TaxID=93504 RepID=UPI00103D4C0B|nr:uncharacterized protein LOC114357615 [Ostrinia furnacalis]
MNGTLQKGLLLVLCVAFGSAALSSLVKTHENVKSLNYSQHFENDTISKVNAKIYKTANKYYCSFQPVENPELIIYGTKSWSFPKQDINLTLSYPTKNEPTPTGDPKKTYIITGFNVILFADTNESQGFITSGGILQESINLTFECSDVSMLVYEFWLYGIPKGTHNVEVASASLLTSLNDLCAPNELYYN